MMREQERRRQTQQADGSVVRAERQTGDPPANTRREQAGIDSHGDGKHGSREIAQDKPLDQDLEIAGHEHAAAQRCANCGHHDHQGVASPDPVRDLAIDHGTEQGAEGLQAVDGARLREVQAQTFGDVGPQHIHGVPRHRVEEVAGEKNRHGQYASRKGDVLGPDHFRQSNTSWPD